MNIYQMHEKLFPDKSFRCLESGLEFKWRFTLLDICLDIRSSLNGAADLLTLSRYYELLEYLRFRVNHWYQCTDEIDLAISIIVKETIRLIENYIKGQ